MQVDLGGLATQHAVLTRDHVPAAVQVVVGGTGNDAALVVYRENTSAMGDGFAFGRGFVPAHADAGMP
ncbi:hypothetical protein GME_16625 [Halomonas sp. TD01]|nr:hypothetical protein GME_16625 [Halomonas sp. TD01]